MLLSGDVMPAEKYPELIAGLTTADVQVRRVAIIGLLKNCLLASCSYVVGPNQDSNLVYLTKVSLF